MKRTRLLVATALVGASAGLYACTEPPAPMDPPASSEGDTTEEDVSPPDSQAKWPDRTVLPIEPYQKVGKLAPTIEASDPIEWPKEVTAPDGAPNVLLIMMDDVGFGASSTFGGPVPTPTLDKLAAEGLRYNRFHTTAVCSSTRASLITGRNHHTAATGIIMEFSTPYPGYNSLMSRSVGTIGEILTDNGWATSWFGKNHNVPDWQSSPAGPFDLWPTGLGWEYFFGFLGADAHQFAPPIYENTQPVEPYLGKPDYHLDQDLADRTIEWIHTRKSIAPDKPFFTYYTPGTAHAPHHAPKEWIAKFKGQFDQGFAAVREATFKRQKELGVIPADADLTEVPEDYQRWDDLSPDMKRVVAREMEVYAAALSHADYQVGRVIDAIDALGEADNTLVIYIMGDNGSSAEDPTGHGMTSEVGVLANGLVDSEKFMIDHIDEFGGPWMQNHYSHSWAHTMNTPFQWDKKIASHLGGTRNGLVISWPKRIKSKGELRTQFTHVTDIVPTILEASGLPQPRVINGVEQDPMAGVSLMYTFDDPDAPGRHETQYFEMIANRAIYHEGWMASTTPELLPWEGGGKRAKDKVTDYKWELYDLTKDFTQAHDLASEQPEKLKELQAVFDEQAKKFQVYPLDDRYIDRSLPENRPQPNKGRSQFVYYEGTERITEGMAPNLKNGSFRITAEVDVPKGGADGILMTQGGWFGGLGLMLRKSKPTFVYRFSHYPEHQWIVQGPAVKPGKHQVAVEFKYDGGGPGKGGLATLSVDGKPVAEGRIERTVPGRLSIDETFDVGNDTGTPLLRDYQVPFAFTGDLHTVTVDLLPPE